MGIKSVVRSALEGAINIAGYDVEFAKKGVRELTAVDKKVWEPFHRQIDRVTLYQQAMDITAKEVDQGTAALIKDLKQRDMLKDTLVIWGGEFGRTPAAQNGDGRNHNNKGYTTWMAGGGIKGGMTYGETDEFGHSAVVDRVTPNDYQATVLHLFGIDHKKLTFKYQGLDQRLTGVEEEAHVIRGILA